MAKTVYIGVAFDTKQLVTGADIATQTIKRFDSVVNDASGNVRNSSVPALDAYTKATINAEKAMRQTTSATVPLKVAKAELTKQTQALQAAMRAQVTTEAGMQAQAKAIAAATRDQAAAQKLYDQSLRSSGKSIDAHSFSLGNLAKGALAAGAAYISFQAVLGVGKSLIDISDKYTMLEGRLKLVTSGSAELASVQASLFDISQKTRVSTQDTSNLYIKLAQSTQGLGISQKQLLGLTESLNKALVVSGASTEEGANAMRQFGQSLAGGIMRGEEYNSVMESTPRVMKMIEDGLGMTRGEMRKVMLDGKLATERLVEGLAKGAAKVDEEFAGMGTTVGQAMVKLKNAYESIVADANEAAEGTDSIAGSIETLTKYLEENKPQIISFAGSLAKIGTDALSAGGSIAGTLTPAVSALAGAIKEIPTAFLLAWLGGRLGGGYGAGAGFIAGMAVDATKKWATNNDRADLDAIQAKRGTKSKFISVDEFIAKTSGEDTVVSAAAPAIKSATAAIQNHTKAVSSGASAASKAATAAEKQAKETDRLREKYEDIIAKTSPVAKLQEEYADKLATVAKAHKELNISIEKQTEDLALLAKQHEESLKKPFEQIARQFEKKTALDEYTSALSKINENLADAAKGEKDRAVQLKAAEEATAGVVVAMQEELKQKGINVKVTRQNAAEIDKAYTQHEASVRAISDVLQSTGNAAGLSSGFISNMVDALDEFNKGALLGGKTIKGLASAMQGIGSQLGGRIGDALAGMGVGLKALLSGTVKNSDGSINQTATDLNQAGGYAAIANGLGGLIGGGVGKSISSGATSAAMGAVIGSIIPGVGTIAGAIVGGVGGLVSSIFGGKSAEEKAAKTNAIAAQEQAIADLASSGSSAARMIMRMSNYDTSAIGAIDSRKLTSILPESITNAKYKSDYRLLDMDYQGKGVKTVEFLSAIAEVQSAMSTIASPSIVKTLDDIAYKYELIGAKIGDNADLQLTKNLEITQALTGFSSDALSQTLEGIVTSTDALGVGKAFSDKLTEGLQASIRQMQISTFVSSIVTPILQPLYADIALSMAAGTDTSSGFAAVQNALTTLTPQVDAFVLSLTDQGVAGYKVAEATASSTIATTAAEMAAGRLSLQMAMLSGTLKTAEATAAEAYSIESELMTALGDTAGLRQRELATLSPLNAALKQMVWTLTDAQTAAATAGTNLTTAQSAATTAQTTLDNARVALDKAKADIAAYGTPSGIQDNVTANTSNSAQDAASAAQAALSDAKTAVTDALNAFKSTIDAQKEALTATYDAATKLIDSQLTAAQTSLTAAESISSAASKFLEGVAGDNLASRQSAQKDLAAALALAQSSGVLPDVDKFNTMLGVLSKPSQRYFSNSVDWARDYYTTANKVSGIGATAQFKMSDAQKAVSIAESQLLVLKETYTTNTAALDAQYNLATDQVAAIEKVNTSVMSLSDALAGYAAAQSAATAAANAVSNELSNNAFATAEADRQNGIINAQNAVITGAQKYQELSDTLAKAQEAYDAALVSNTTAQTELVTATLANTNAQSALTEAVRKATEAISAQKAIDNSTAASAPMTSSSSGAYITTNSDLWNLYASDQSVSAIDLANAAQHYNTQGVLEGRAKPTGMTADMLPLSLTDTQLRKYLTGNADLMAAFGGATESGLALARKHYFEQGHNEILEGARLRTFARGGISEGPSSGYLATLHGTEAVVPLSNGRSIPVSINFKEMVDELKSLREEVISLRGDVKAGNKDNAETKDGIRRINNMGIKVIA